MLPPKKAIGIHLLVLAPIVFGTLLLILACADQKSPTVRETVEILTRCPYRQLTGSSCPLCGTTTGTCLLLSGEFSAAWSTQPLAVALLLVSISQTFYRLWRILRPRWCLSEELVFDGFAVVLSVTAILL